MGIPFPCKNEVSIWQEKMSDDLIRCSFCNKTQAQVRKLIAGPNGAYICDECIDVCAEIIEEEFAYEDESKFSGINLLKPEEIKAFLDDYVIGQDEAKKSVSSFRVQSLQKNYGRERPGSGAAEE